MPLPVIANVLRVTVRGTCPSGKRFANVLHFHWTGAGAAIAAVAALDTQLQKLVKGPAYASGTAAGAWLNNAGAGTTVQDIVYLPLDGVGAAVINSVNAAGADVQARLPDEVAAVVTFRSAARGRSFRGRVYLPAPTISAITTGTFNAGYLTAVIAQFQGFNTAAFAAQWTHVVASYKLGITTPVATYTMDNKPDVQRRRK